FVYLLSIVIGLGLGSVRPLPFVPSGLTAPVGMALVVTAVALFVWSVRTFRAAGTPVPGNAPTMTIVRAGPYRFSRNPIYVALSLLVLGISVWADDAWLLGMLLAAVAVMSTVVIPREELYLERKFGAEYLDYKSAVRRWL